MEYPRERCRIAKQGRISGISSGKELDRSYLSQLPAFSGLCYPTPFLGISHLPWLVLSFSFPEDIPLILLILLSLACVILLFSWGSHLPHLSCFSGLCYPPLFPRISHLSYLSCFLWPVLSYSFPQDIPLILLILLLWLVLSWFFPEDIPLILLLRRMLSYSFLEAWPGNPEPGSPEPSSPREAG